MIREIYSQFYKNIITLVTWPGELASMFIYPFIGLLSLGFFGDFALEGGVTSAAFVFIVYGVLSWSIYSNGQQAMTRGFLYELWSGSLKNLFSTRIRIKEFIVGNVLFSIFSVAGTVGLLFIFSWIVFGFNVLAAGPLMVIGIIGILLQAFAESLLILCSLVKFGHKFTSLSWIMPGIIMVLCGVYYPIELLPGPIRIISNVLPATHAISGIRNLVLSPEIAANELTMSIFLGVIYMLIAISIFKFSIYSSKRDGSLATLTE